MFDCVEIGDRIRELRIAKNLTQLELSKKLNVKRETINQWERGSRDLKTNDIIELAVFFEVSCDEILRGMKPENLEIYLKTGLSDAAIDVLTHYTKVKSLNLKSGPTITASDFISAFLVNDNFHTILKVMADLVISNERIKNSAEYQPFLRESNLNLKNHYRAKAYQKYWKLFHYAYIWVDGVIRKFIFNPDFLMDIDSFDEGENYWSIETKE